MGADVHAMDDCAIRLAAENNHIDVVILLLNHCAHVNAMDDYALRWSVEKGQYKMVKLLLENGANAQAKNNFALVTAIERRMVGMAKLLLDYGADIHVKGDWAFGWIPKYYGTDHEMMSLLKYNKIQGPIKKIFKRTIISDAECYICLTLLADCNKVCMYKCGHMTCGDCQLKMLMETLCGYCRQHINFAEYEKVIVKKS